ncbi:hypothetical protein SETIT_7G014400v2 [Setaria italica]|uniref:F-box associated domain-containing protein n=1 Tax=Setaria italica TaxID=4555 RepID=A0A368RR16_SETIT|nr:hypothetical protein SETIT_7G014400v2 [Setaria italica]
MEVAVLPDDALADVLRRLPPRSLAHGPAPALLRRRSASPAAAFPKIDGTLGFMPNDGRNFGSVLHQCNGLLLCEHEWESGLCVCNSATWRWQVLPRPEEASVYSSLAYLAFDPAASPHYEVFLIPEEPKIPAPPNHWMLEIKQPAEPPYHLMEWPPSPFRLEVFSSRTGGWEIRIDFVREGKAAGTVQDVYLGKSMHGVCFGVIDEFQLQVWILIESCGQMEWVSKYQDNLRRLASLSNVNGKLSAGTWVIQEDNIDEPDIFDNIITSRKESCEWDSDNDDLFTVEEVYPNTPYDNFYILGFHPYKEVVFVVKQFEVLAYRLDSSKIHYVGNCRPKCYRGIYESFLYTPCMIGELLHGDNTDQNSSEG